MDVVDFSNVDHVYIVCGRTDMRRGIDGLAGIISNDYGLQVYSKSVFLFCGRRADRYKGLYWDGDGFMLLYKRIENGKLQWPRNDNEVSGRCGVNRCVRCSVCWSSFQRLFAQLYGDSSCCSH